MSLAAPGRDALAPPARTPGAAAAAEPRLARMLAFLAVFVVTWTLYFAITEAPVSIKHDMAEAYAWGRQFELGYNQHPPFWAWICGLWFRLFPRREWAFAALSSLNAAVGLLGAWFALGDFAAGSKRMAAWVLLLLTPLYTFYAYKYDANIIFISIWPWTLHYFMRSLQGRGRRDAAWFGVCAGLALMSKYYALILLFACFLAALQHPRRRAYFGSAAPYLAAAVTAVICAPHVWWLIAHRAPPLRYLDSRLDWSWQWVVDHAARAFFGVVGMNLGVAVIVALARWSGRRAGHAAVARDPRDPTLRLLATLTLTPLVLTIASGLALRTTVTSEMMVGTFPLLPLLAIELAGVADTARLFRVSARLAALLMFGALAIAPGFAWWRTWLSPAAMKVEPFQEVAIEATRIWHARTSLPLDYVTGSAWYENETAFYSPDRPHAFEDFDYGESLWVTPQDIARHGLLSICIRTDKACLAATARFATPGTTRTDLTAARRFWGHVARRMQFVVTVIPPRA
jgi:4-amino-4-deoxy-L-arabinose transferase-like glycosyltransferase